MLRLLSGREHVVWSGLCLWSTASHEFRVESASSTLLMQPLSSQMIEEYLDTRAWEGKSGAFGYQDNHPWLTLTTGSARNVVGLPMELLREMLPLMSQG
jgi:septum formation protein